MTKSPEIYLSHILASINALEEYMSGVTEEQFYADRKLQMAAIKELEIIGEAVRNLPREFKDKYPSIPWKGIAGMRNFLIHEYFEIDLDLVWDTIESRIPELKTEIKKLMKK